jgi:hypothetical protein
MPWNTSVYSGYNGTPDLSPGPLDYNIIDIASIPVHFFMELHKLGVWNYHVRRYE